MEDDAHPGLSIARGIGQAFNASVKTVSQLDAAETGDSEREPIALIVLVGDYDQVIRCWRLRLFFPEAFRRLHL